MTPRQNRAPKSVPQQVPLQVTHEAAARSKVKVGAQDAINPFKPALHPPGIAPSKGLAQDECFSGTSNWAFNVLTEAGYGGQGFLGYAILSELAQRPEYRKITETISTEATRRWIKIQAVGEDDKSEEIAALNEVMDNFRVRDRFRESAEHDGYFGRGHLYLDFGDSGPNELSSDIGDGLSGASKQKITQGSLKGIRCIEPIWIYPVGYNSSNPLQADWYKPQAWRVNGTEVHASRLLTMVGREVPDILKAAYSFGGLSMSQMAKPYIDNWLRTRQSVSDAVYRFSLDVLKTDMANALNANGGADFFNRIALLQNVRDVNSAFVIDKEREDFQTVSKQLGTLESLQAQSQEQMASIAGIPLVKLLGITPSGLNASSDGEVRCFYDSIHAYQERLFRGPLDRVFKILQRHLFGAVDPDLTYRFEPLWTLDEKEQAEVNEIKTRTLITLSESGIVSDVEVRSVIAGDENMPFNGLDPDDLPAPDPTEVLPEVPEPQVTHEPDDQRQERVAAE